MFPAMVTGEGLATFIMVETYGYAIIGLIVSFLFAIWIGSKKAHSNLIKENKLIRTSFTFSLTINTIIWTTFIIVTVIDNIDNNILYVLIFPVIGYIVSVIMTTFTIGLLVTYIFEINLKREKKRCC
ncbi:hypothetical protein ACFLQ5_02965 [Bacteroidota bacterium]